MQGANSDCKPQPGVRAIQLKLQILLCSLAIGCFFTPAVAAENCLSQADTEYFYSDGWGFGLGNQRFQSATELTRDNVNQLELQWVFALDESMSPHSYPLVTTDSVFIGTDEGNVYALDRDSGCTRWKHPGQATVRTAIIHGVVTHNGVERTALFFGTSEGKVQAIDALDGSPLWSADIKEHPFNVVTGTPLFNRGRLYVPVSSMELGLAISPFYECCKSSGALIALDAGDGSKLWTQRSVSEPAKVVDRHWYFVKEWGPSGAPLWSAPTMDEDLGLVFAGTGENYTAPATLTSDAIIAFDHKDGQVRWSRQFTAKDTFNMACSVSLSHPNCPADTGPDHDFGAPPILVKNKLGEKVLLAGQKSAAVYAMDPANGDLLWEQQLGRGGYLGGVHWGMAVNEALGLLYVPLNDLDEGPAIGGNRPRGCMRWISQPAKCVGRRHARATVRTVNIVVKGFRRRSWRPRNLFSPVFSME